MAPVELKKATSFATLAPGTWTKLTGEAAAVWVACAECGVRGSLEDHRIAPDGTISPSLVCPAECGWHVYGRLIGWAP